MRPRTACLALLGSICRWCRPTDPTVFHYLNYRNVHVMSIRHSLGQSARGAARNADLERTSASTVRPALAMGNTRAPVQAGGRHAREATPWGGVSPLQPYLGRIELDPVDGRDPHGVIRRRKPVVWRWRPPAIPRRAPVVCVIPRAPATLRISPVAASSVRNAGESRLPPRCHGLHPTCGVTSSRSGHTTSPICHR